MKQCIVHLGIPKTRTKSIQQSLCFGLSDLEWLAAASRSAPIRATNRQEAALALCAQMHRLRRMGSQQARFLRLKASVERTLTHFSKWIWQTKAPTTPINAQRKGQQS